MLHCLLQLVSKLWVRWQTSVLWILIAGMAAKAVLRISYGLTCLLFLKGTKPAVDLAQRYNEIQLWFAGGDVYTQLEEGGVYPPASHVILWPFLNYSSWTLIRYLWAITSVAALIWLVYLLVKASQASNVQEKVLIALISLSAYATNINFINGQLTIHILAFLVAALTLIKTNKKKLTLGKSSLWAGFFLAVALVKPTVTLPFFFIPLFVSQGLLIAIVAVVIYTIFALIATAFQNASIVTLHLDWLERGKLGTEVSSTANSNNLAGYGDIHSFLASRDISDFNFESSMIILVIFAVWLYFHRYVDLWILIGVAALVSRFWAYHRIYDDLVIILPMVTLFRLTKQTNVDQINRIASGIMLAIAIFSTFLLDRLLLFNPPKNSLFAHSQIVVWLLMLGFMIFQAFQQRNSQFNNYKSLVN